MAGVSGAESEGGEQPCYAEFLDPEGQLKEHWIDIRRVYEAGPTPGYRVLVDGIWPRGLRKEDLDLDLWARDLAPSQELRRWFGHRPERWKEFQDRYRRELQDARRRRLLEELVAMAREGPLTLLYGARDQEHNQAVVIRDVLAKRLP